VSDTKTRRIGRDGDVSQCQARSESEIPKMPQCDLPKERESVSSSDYGREGYCDICEFSPEVLGAEGQKR